MEFYGTNSVNTEIGKRRKDIKRSGLFYKLGNVSDKTISIFACVAVGLVLVEPAIMCLFTFYSKSMDIYLMISYVIVAGWVFPLASLSTLIIYILVFLKIRNDNKGLLFHLKKNPLLIIFSLAVVLMVISQIYNINNGYNSGFTDTPDYVRNESFDMQYCYFLVLLFAGTQVRLEKHKKVLLRSQLIISILVVVFAFIHWNVNSFSFMFEDQSEIGFLSYFTNRNYYAYYLAVQTPLAGALFVHDKNVVWKVIAIFSFIMNTIALSLNDCMGGWVATAFAIIFIILTYAIINKKFSIKSLILIPIFCIVIYIPGHIVGSFEANVSVFGSDIADVISGAEGSENAGSGRIKLWTAALDVINDNKLFGIGFEGVYVREYVGAPYMTRPHNEFLQYAMFYGIPMAIMYFSGCLGMFIRALRKKKNIDSSTLCSLTAAFGYLVSSFFGLTVFSTAMFLFVFMGMGYVRENEVVDNAETVDVSQIENTTRLSM